ncbi:MAG: RNA-binding domain-containing protein [Candidatus Poseidoniales archaeon]|jgi:RNA binding exosome subunit|tara:strand:+ start:482 stop:919 length:438 start_codon:yes stop_codon:yes gene_type:complete
MPVHQLTWRATASGIEDEMVLAEALATLIGDEEAVEIEQTNSYHGSPIHIVSARLTRAGPAQKALSNIGKENLKVILSELETRLDETNVIHFRLDQSDLISGILTLSQPGGQATIKGQTKIQVYPGQSPLLEAKSTIQKAIESSN